MGTGKPPHCSHQINAFVEMGRNGILGEGSQRREKRDDKDSGFSFHDFYDY
jgi:hypothetical protein